MPGIGGAAEDAADQATSNAKTGIAGGLALGLGAAIGGDTLGPIAGGIAAGALLDGQDADMVTQLGMIQGVSNLVRGGSGGGRRRQGVK